MTSNKQKEILSRQRNKLLDKIEKINKKLEIGESLKFTKLKNGYYIENYHSHDA
jgi:hypothetical protein